MIARRLNIAEQALQTEAAIKGSPSSVLPYTIANNAELSVLRRLQASDCKRKPVTDAHVGMSSH
jgi:hypothetical protein